MGILSSWWDICFEKILGDSVCQFEKLTELLYVNIAPTKKGLDMSWSWLGLISLFTCFYDEQKKGENVKRILILAMSWPWHDDDLAMICLWRGDDLAMTWQWLGNDLAMIWRENWSEKHFEIFYPPPRIFRFFLKKTKSA